MTMAGLVVLLNACIPLLRSVEVERVQTLHVTSDPPGAEIYILGQQGAQLLGFTPMKISVPYLMVERRANEAGCAMSGADAVADFVPPPEAAHSASGQLALAAVGFFSRILGAAAGVQACREAEGTEVVQRVPIFIQAKMAGHKPAGVRFEIPREDDEVHFQLEAISQRRSETENESSIKNPTVVVFDLLGYGENIEPELLILLADGLAERVRSFGAYKAVYRENPNNWVLEDKPDKDCQADDCQLAICESIGASHGLVAMLMKTEQSCTLSATLFDVKKSRAIKNANLKAACDERSLEAHLDDLMQRLK
jgi:hypothetical protein